MGRYKRYKEQKEELKRVRKERNFWKKTVIYEVENNITDSTGAVSENKINNKMREHEKALQQALKEVCE